ncbi:MAG TPA: aminotransferase class V-fold PLP-dependent enzyme [Puia sp.]|jgi:isopenicillin-N epimerase|nr:aminotransferase class V-fold PLP-dependent enzyme [Puia sp.]
MPLPVLQSQFLLNPEITYLNFGSFSACPRPIFEDYQRWQRELEYEPVQFINVKGPRYLERSRQALGDYIHCPADDVVYTPNPSYAINTIARSFALSPGDEILGTDLEYEPFDRTWNYYCQKKGATYIRRPVRLPIHSKEELIGDFFEGVTSRTKAIFLSHITSTTALRLPVEEICAIAKQKGLVTIIDGAHAPGHIPLDLSRLQADIYTGACHKWMLTPKGSSFLYVKKELQPLFDPLIIGWGYDSASPSNSRFLDYHQMQGTRDFSAFLTIPRAIEFMQEHHWTDIASSCRQLVQHNALRFCDWLGAEPLSPISDEFLGQMFSIPIRTPDPEKLKRHLFDSYHIEIGVNRQNDRVLLRYSINAFNSQSDLDKLFAALQQTAAQTPLLSRLAPQ